MHSILKKQIEKVFGDKPVSSFGPEFQKLFDAIDSTYSDFEADRVAVGQSLEVSDKKLHESNQKQIGDLEKLHKGEADIEKLEDSRRAVINILKDLKAAKEEAEEAKDKFEKIAKTEQENRLQLEQFNKVMIGRELKMVELKEKLEAYEKRLHKTADKN